MKTNNVSNTDSGIARRPVRMLSTSDNPFNPFLQWDDWLAFDTQNGYNSCGYLARIVRTSDELSELDQSLAIDEAINEILLLNVTGTYIAVIEETFEIIEGTRVA